MKIQTKKLLFGLISVGSIAAATIGGTATYGLFSKKAKGWKIKASQSKSDFMLGEEFTDEYDYKFINNLGEVDKTIGQYIPPKKNGNSNNYGIVKVNGKTFPVDDFIDDFRKENNNEYPLFTIKSSYFTFDNRYLAAVSADDWAKLAFWFLGDSKTNGNLSYGPEAGSISTFQILPGIEKKGNSITLGNYAMLNRERGRINFYPDAFFGASQVYTPYDNGSGNNLAAYFFVGLEFTIEEAREFIKAVNEAMKYSENNPLIKNKFGIKGDSVPRPLSIIPSSITIKDDGTKIQKYKILSEFFNAKNNDPTGKSLLEKVGDEFPELLTQSTEYYVEKDHNGFYEIKYGKNNHWDPSTTVGLPQILKSVDPNFKGFDIDFLKYVAVHEFGHHQTLINASDLSQGGYVAQGINSQKNISIDGLNNIDVLNDYFKARSSGLEAVPVNPYGNEFSTDEERSAAESPYFSFRMPNGEIEKYSGIVGKFEYDKRKQEWNPSSNQDEPYRAFHNTINDLQTKYVDNLNNNNPLKIYDAYIMNSFDDISGSLNPSTSIPVAARTLYVIKSDDIPNTDWNGNKLINLLFEMFRNKLWNSKGEIQRENLNNSFYKSFTTQVEDVIKDNIKNRYEVKLNIKNQKASNNITIIEAELQSIIKYFTNFDTKNKNTDNAKKIASWKEILQYISNKMDKVGRTDKAELEKIAEEFVSKKSPSKLIAGTEKFYDFESKGWVPFEVMIQKSLLDSDPDGPKQVLKPHTINSPSTDPDFDLTSLNFLRIKPNTIFKFNLIDPKTILDADGNNWLDHWSKNIKDSTDKDKSDDSQQAKNSYIDIVIKPIVKNLINLEFGHPGKYLSQIEGGRRPEFSDFHFPDYVYNYAESMTRDLVQISLPQEQSFLANTNPFISMSQSGTSFEYYVDKELTKEYDPNDENTHVTSDESEEFLDIMESETSIDTKAWLSQFMNEKNLLTSRPYLLYSNNIESNNFLYKDKFMSNGYEKDRQQRELLGWSLYDIDGSARTINPADGINIENPRNGNSATSWAEAYWYFLLKMRGIGDRNITAIFRDPDLDLLYAYGFIDLEDASIKSGKEKPEFLAFKNTETGKIIYEKIYYQKQDTLFYLTHQGKDESRHTLDEENYIGWSTNRFSAGQYVNEDLTLGEYEVYFANSDRSRSDLQLKMGQRNYIAENGKFYKQAPTLFEKQQNGSVIYRVNTRFNGG